MTLAEQSTSRSGLSQLGAAVGPLLLIATLLNGAPAFLKRVGAIDRDRYQAFWSTYCEPNGVTSRAFGLGRTCRFTNPNTRATADHRERVNRRFAYTLEVDVRDVPAKVFKDLLMVGIAIIGVLLTISGEQRISLASPLVLLSILIAAAVPFTLLRHGEWAVLAGLRTYLFLAVAVAGAYASAGELLERIVPAVALILVAQLLLVPWELLSSIPFMGLGPSPFLLPRRLAAGFVQPNTLGAFAALAIAFCIGSTLYKRHAAVLWAASALVVFLAASGTGVVVLASLLVAVVARGTLRTPAAAGVLLIGCLAVATLPTLLNRPDMLDSLVGPGSRMDALGSAFSQPILTVLFGQGLGTGSNTLALLTAGKGADSALVLLVEQIGVLGAACFYWILGWAGWHAPRLRPFYAAVAVCSLTLNVTEVFPLNLMLGLGLAHSAARAASDAAAQPC